MRVVRNLDWPVVRFGAGYGLALIIPAALISAVLASSDSSSNLAFLFSFLILIGFVVAGYVAGNRRTDTPMMHGAAAALSCYVVVQLFGLLRRLAAGDDINLFTYPLAALFAATCGVAGAVFADWNRRRLSRS
ncbi:MAG: hypothetical protein ACI8TP_004213 [Acidimicrobiales bacterium]|jgi:hypothetical protein